MNVCNLCCGTNRAKCNVNTGRIWLQNHFRNPCWRPSRTTLSKLLILFWVLGLQMKRGYCKQSTWGQRRWWKQFTAFRRCNDSTVHRAQRTRCACVCVCVYVSQSSVVATDASFISRWYVHKSSMVVRDFKQTLPQFPNTGMGCQWQHKWLSFCISSYFRVCSL